MVFRNVSAWELVNLRLLRIEEIKLEDELILENEYDETYDDPADESYEEDIDENQDKTNSEKFDNTDFNQDYKMFKSSFNPDPR